MVADHGYVIPPRYWAWSAHPTAVRVWAWLFAVVVAAHHLDQARRWAADPPDTPAPLRRPDPGGQGHRFIDFGGQWVMGRMVVLGHARELYHRQAQWGVVRAGFPEADEPPAIHDDLFRPPRERLHHTPDATVKHDADRMMYWFMGAEPAAVKAAGGAAATPLAAADPLAAL
ncbi:MAG: hypothetical protein K2X87_15305, partial [Gemmataceae bacterium]|nr:hypothetical protein [Gemmataceae bacterium]